MASDITTPLGGSSLSTDTQPVDIETQVQRPDWEQNRAEAKDIGVWKYLEGLPVMRRFSDFSTWVHDFSPDNQAAVTVLKDAQLQAVLKSLDRLDEILYHQMGEVEEPSHWSVLALFIRDWSSSEVIEAIKMAGKYMDRIAGKWEHGACAETATSAIRAFSSALDLHLARAVRNYIRGVSIRLISKFQALLD
ncbi:MAG: hypothetical protein Q9220_006421 [cf. Caloplaca sp. 1 TL-2023]